MDNFYLVSLKVASSHIIKKNTVTKLLPIQIINNTTGMKITVN